MAGNQAVDVLVAVAGACALALVASVAINWASKSRLFGTLGSELR
jgi:hypothetical protein